MEGVSKYSGNRRELTVATHISVLCILPAFQMVSDTNGIYKGAAMRLIYFFPSGTS